MDEEWDFDPCDDCTANGDDYYIDENGEMVCACYLCYFRDFTEDD